MADVPLVAGGAVDAPLGYVVPGAQEIILKSVTATFDGSGASGDYVPTLEILAPNGMILASCPVSTPVVAGASAFVTWFPRGGVATSTSTGKGIEYEKDNEGKWLDVGLVGGTGVPGSGGAGVQVHADIGTGTPLLIGMRVDANGDGTEATGITALQALSSVVNGTGPATGLLTEGANSKVGQVGVGVVARGSGTASVGVQADVNNDSGLLADAQAGLLTNSVVVWTKATNHSTLATAKGQIYLKSTGVGTFDLVARIGTTETTLASG